MSKIKTTIWGFVLVAMIALAFSLAFAEEIKTLQVMSPSGSGGLVNPVGGIVSIELDSTPDLTGASFKSATLATAMEHKNIKSLKGYFLWDESWFSFANADSVFTTDSMEVIVRTGYTNHEDDFSLILQGDTILIYDTIWYTIPNAGDSLFRDESWFDFRIWDSTSKGLATRNYRVKMGLTSH